MELAASSGRCNRSSTARKPLWAGRQSGGLRAHRLEPVQIIDGALRMGSGLEDRAVVVLENLEPSGYVGRVILLDFRSEFEVGASEGGSQFGDEFLAGVTFISTGADD